MSTTSRILTSRALATLVALGVPALLTAATPAVHGLDLAGMDRKVVPGDAFFDYANGTWLKTAPIAPDRSGAGTGAQLTDLTAARTAALIKAAAAKKAPEGTETRMVGDFYASFMDEAAIEKAGLKPLKPTLDRIAAVADRAGLAQVLGLTLRADVDVLNATNLYTDNILGLWVAQDLNDPTKYTPFLLQGGLGLPDRDYYLDPSPRMTEIRAKYLAHIIRTLKLAQVAGAEAKAAAILDLELKIAQTHWARVDTGDVLKGNNHWTRQDFDTKAPGLDWAAYFKASGLQAQQDFVVWQPSAIIGISALVASVPVDTWKDYLAFHAVEHAADYLPKAFLQESFSFYGQVLSGTPQLRDRWKRGVDATSKAMGEAVGKLYVAKYFPPSEKARVQAMVTNIMAAFSHRIDQLPWMAPATKAKAKAKLAVLKVGVGYPDKWIDYNGLMINREDALGNAQRAEVFELRRNLRKLGRPVDRGEWVMNPQLVNAVNLPAMNALNFPAAILQPPYLDPRRPIAMDYAATGATIGHEISHSFDDQGALFDAEGRLNNWWTKEDMEHFQASATQLVNQFDGYRPFPELGVNGRQTLGENIADVAGLASAYDAYRLQLGKGKAKVVQGFTGDQQFFLSFAQSWREKRREPALRRQLLTDGHPPAQFRALTVRNLDAWYEAFDVKPGQALFLTPENRVRIW
jgi:predicted metalloendopeptidase